MLFCIWIYYQDGVKPGEIAMPENTVEESRSQQAVIVILHFSPKIRAKKNILLSMSKISIIL